MEFRILKSLNNNLCRIGLSIFVMTKNKIITNFKLDRLSYKKKSVLDLSKEEEENMLFSFIQFFVQRK
jgi:hypothetical protein